MVHRVLWTEFAEVNIAQTREMALSENFIKFSFFWRLWSPHYGLFGRESITPCSDPHVL